MEKNIKKIFNSLKHRVSVDFNTEDMPQHYHFIDNFDNTTEEECIKLDNKNKDIYKHNIDLYKNISEKLRKHNAMIKLETAPMPPSHPNNYEKYIMHKTRNVSKNVRHQSFAITYLIQKGYKMCLNNKQEESNLYELSFEPYEAIEIVESLENNNIENIIKNRNSNMKPAPLMPTAPFMPSMPPMPSAPPMTVPNTPLLYNFPLSSSLPNTIPLTLQRANSELNINSSSSASLSMPQLNHLNHSMSQSNINNVNITDKTVHYRRHNTTN